MNDLSQDQKDQINEDLSRQPERLDFSVWDIVTVYEWEYKGTWLKLMEIKENWICVLRVSPDNEITIEVEFDKVKSLASFEESYAKVTEQTVLWVFWWRNIQ